MTKTCLLVAALAAFSFAPADASGLTNRAWVSGHGVDQAGCGAPASPCRTFQYAHDNVVASGGEIDVLDPGGYGPITITKAISIVNDGVGVAGVQQGTANQSAIVVHASATDKVLLRGLTIEGLDVASHGVTLTSAGLLDIQNCILRGFAQNGLNLAGGGTTVHVSDTIVSDYGNSGVYFSPSASAAAFYERVQAIGPGYTGFLVNGDLAASGSIIKAQAADSVGAGNYVGFFANGSNDASVHVSFMAVNAKAFNNSYGVTAQLATMFITQSSIYGNSAGGYSVDSGGTIKTFGNNSIADTTNGGSLTPIQMQ